MRAGSSTRGESLRRRMGTLGWWSAACVVVAAVGLLVVSIRPADKYGSARAEEVAALEQLAAADALLEAQLASGFVPYRDDTPFAGGPVEGWLPVQADQRSLAKDYDEERHRVPVYSTADRSDILGFDYTFIGFVPFDVAESTEFDPEAVRREAFGGCDPLDPSRPPEDCPLDRWVEPHITP